MDAQEKFRARLAESRSLHPSWDDRYVATARARARACRVQVIPHTAEAITADLDANRIRLFLNEHGIVVRASGGQGRPSPPVPPTTAASLGESSRRV